MKIPPNYLHTVTGRLKKAGYVETLRGQFGGYRIQEPADELTLYDVISLLEPEKINRCLDDDHPCTRHSYGVCAVSRFYALAQEDWDNKLKKMTLKVLAADPDRNRLRQILNS